MAEVTALPDMLTVPQLAELLDCTTDTVEERTRERTLPGLKYGRSWVYPRDAVLEVLRQQALAHVRPEVGAQHAAPAPKPLAIAPRPAKRAARPRGRSPAPLPDPPRVP